MELGGLLIKSVSELGGSPEIISPQREAHGASLLLMQSRKHSLSISRFNLSSKRSVKGPAAHHGEKAIEGGGGEYERIRSVRCWQIAIVSD